MELHFCYRLDILLQILFYIYAYPLFSQSRISCVPIQYCSSGSYRYQCTRSNYRLYEQLQYSPRTIQVTYFVVFLCTRCILISWCTRDIHDDCIPDQKFFHRYCCDIPHYGGDQAAVLGRWWRECQKMEIQYYLDICWNIRDADSILSMEYTTAQKYWRQYRSISRLGVLGQCLLTDSQSPPDARSFWIPPDGGMGIFHPSICWMRRRKNQKIK